MIHCSRLAFYGLVVVLMFLSKDILAQETPVKRFKKLDSLSSVSIEHEPAVALNQILEMEKLLPSLPADSFAYIVHFKKAGALRVLDQFDESIKIWYDMLRTYEKKEDAKKVAAIVDELGLHFFNIGEYAKALELYERAKKLCLQKKYYADTLKLNMEIAIQHAGLGDFQKSIRMLEQNIANAKKEGDEITWAHGMDNLSNVYFEMQDFEKSLKYQIPLLQSTYIQSSTYLKGAILQHLADTYLHLDDLKNAQWYLDSAFVYIAKFNSKDWLFECHKTQYNIYKKSGKYKEALFHHEQFINFKDSVFTESFENKLTGLSSLYELEHKQAKIEKLDFQHKVSSIKIQRLTLGIISALLLAVLVYLYLVYRHKKQDEIRTRNFTKTLLMTQENERKRIAAELHDSIGQNILFIKNQVKKISGDNEKNLNQTIDETLAEVRNISKDLFPTHLEKLGLEKSVLVLSEQISGAFPLFISSDLSGIDDVTDKNTKINIFRVIQEFINNSVKHANASAVRITSEVVGKTLQLILQDNGSGFNVELARQKSNPSVGLFSMEERIHLLDGHIQMVSELQSGTTFTISLPLDLQK